MKQLCIVDTCSLVYQGEVDLVGSPLHRWLWKEFEVRYSETVWDEINRHAQNMGRDWNWLRKEGGSHVWNLSTMTAYENTLFASDHYRKMGARKCSFCKQSALEDQAFTPNLSSSQDRGERHNCCIALAAITGQYQQTIYLTDDNYARRDYVAHVFETFNLGQIWSSLDFVLHLFVRHRKHIPLSGVLVALRDINAQSGNPTTQARRLS